VNFKDNAYLYNAATAAMKVKKYAEAVKYYDMSIQAKYKVGSSYQGKAIALRDQGDVAGMLATLQEGMKAVPNNMKLETMFATHYMKEGQKFQKAGKEAKAVEAYNMITSLNNKSFKVQGFLSLGTLYFNNGAQILQEVNQFANTDKAKYEAGKAKLWQLSKKQKHM
jgi:pilus assembly protein Flp/PilA